MENKTSKVVMSEPRIRLLNTRKLIDCNMLMKVIQQSLSSIIKKNKAELVIGKLPRIKVYKEEFISLFQNLMCIVPYYFTIKK